MTRRTLDIGSDFLSVVIPVFNEQDTIYEIIDKVSRIPNLLEIVIVDDGSTDNTPQLLATIEENNTKITLVRHERNLGKTEALKTAFSTFKGDIVIIQDADLEYDPDEISDVIRPIVDGKADVVYGSRFLVRKASRVLYFYHYLGNKLLTFLSNTLTNLNMTDMETCYKAFRGEIIRNMNIYSKGFGFEVEVTAKVAKLARRGFSIYEVPISYYGRTYEEGKKIGAIDALSAIIYILRFNLFCSLKSSYRSIPVRQK